MSVVHCEQPNEPNAYTGKNNSVFAKPPFCFSCLVLSSLLSLSIHTLIWRRGFIYKRIATCNYISRGKAFVIAAWLEKSTPWLSHHVGNDVDCLTGPD